MWDFNVGSLRLYLFVSVWIGVRKPQLYTRDMTWNIIFSLTITFLSTEFCIQRYYLIQGKVIDYVWTKLSFSKCIPLLIYSFSLVSQLHSTFWIPRRCANLICPLIWNCFSYECFVERTRSRICIRSRVCTPSNASLPIVSQLRPNVRGHADNPSNITLNLFSSDIWFEWVDILQL